MNEALSTPPDYDMLAKTRAVMGYQADIEKPGRPLDLLLGGGVVACISLILIGVVAYRTWYSQTMATDWAYAAIGLLFVFYTFGVFLFAYGYELYDMPRALRLTLIICGLSVVAIFLFIALLAILSKLKDAPSSGGRQDGSSFLARPLFSAIGSMVEDRIEASGAESRREREEEAAVETKPFVVHCAGCGETYTPLPPRAECPGCGRSAFAVS